MCANSIEMQTLRDCQWAVHTGLIFVLLVPMLRRLLSRREGQIFLIPGLLDQAFIVNLYHNLGENAAGFCSARSMERHGRVLM